MGCYVLDFQEIDQTQLAVVGGKGAYLAELARIEGIRVPSGFCVTTDALNAGVTVRKCGAWPTTPQTSPVAARRQRSVPLRRTKRLGGAIHRPVCVSRNDHDGKSWSARFE